MITPIRSREYGDRIVPLMRDGESSPRRRSPVVRRIRLPAPASPDFIKTLCFMQAATGVVSRAYAGLP